MGQGTGMGGMERGCRSGGRLGRRNALHGDGPSATVKRQWGEMERVGWEVVSGERFVLHGGDGGLLVYRVVPLGKDGAPLAHPAPLQWEDHFAVWAGSLDADGGMPCREGLRPL